MSNHHALQVGKPRPEQDRMLTLEKSKALNQLQRREEGVQESPRKAGREMPEPHLPQQGRLIPGGCQKLTSQPTPWVQPERLIAQWQSIPLEAWAWAFCHLSSQGQKAHTQLNKRSASLCHDYTVKGGRQESQPNPPGVSPSKASVSFSSPPRRG